MPSVMMEVSPRLTPKESIPDSIGWKGRHLRAARVHPVAVMISALDLYAAQYERDNSDEDSGTTIGWDGVLGPAFLDALRGARTMLNGEIGGLDGGTCDAALLGIFHDAGFEGEL